MAQANEDREDCGEMSEMHAVEPAHGVWLKFQVFRMRNRGKRGMAEPDRVDAPGDKNHDHDCRDLHDAHGLLARSEEHTSELQSHLNLVCRLLLEKKKNEITIT